MIIDELRSEICHAIRTYISKFAEGNIPVKRQLEIVSIENILKESSPLIICQELDKYLDSLAVPFFIWFILLDIYTFIRPLKEILRQDKYKEINLLRRIIAEKDEIIAQYELAAEREKAPKTVEQQLLRIMEELKLLKNENAYLYATLGTLDSKIVAIENESKINLQRAEKAEQELVSFKKRFNAAAEMEMRFKRI